MKLIGETMQDNIVTLLFEDDNGDKIAENISIELWGKIHEVSKSLQRNEKRVRARDERHTVVEYIEGLTELYALVTVYDPVREEIEQAEERLRVYSAINDLPAVQRTRLLAYFIEGKSYKEIAQRDGVSINAIHKSINLAIKKINKLCSVG